MWIRQIFLPLKFPCVRYDVLLPERLSMHNYLSISIGINHVYLNLSIAVLCIVASVISASNSCALMEDVCVLLQVLWSECYLCKVDMMVNSNTISSTLAAMEKVVGRNQNLQGKVEALQKWVCVFFNFG